MAKSNETTLNTPTSTNVATGSILWRANYQYVAKNSQLRGGTIVVEADTKNGAEEKAKTTLAELGLNNYRLTSVKTF